MQEWIRKLGLGSVLTPEEIKLITALQITVEEGQLLRVDCRFRGQGARTQGATFIEKDGKWVEQKRN